MIKETFTALKAIGVEDQHILNVLVALEARHEEHRHNFDLMRDEIHGIKHTLAVLTWAMAVWPTVLFGLGITILLKVWK
jgi:hypothetical protein